MEARSRILILAGTYSSDGENPWLIDDLVAQLAKSGVLVDVVVHDTRVPRRRGIYNSGMDGVRCFSVGAVKPARTPLGRIYGRLSCVLRLHISGRRFIGKGHYDLCVFTSIGTMSGGFARRIKREGLVDSLLFILWDFFPIHHIEIGRLHRAPWNDLLKRTERWSIETVDVIAVMSAANERFLRSYHPGLSATTMLLPPWSGDVIKRADTASRYDDFTVVFGGQLTKGRGVETLLLAAGGLLHSAVPVRIVIIGGGPLTSWFRASAAKAHLTNVTFIDALEREQYRCLLRRAHVGLAITVPGVSVPSFPSKIVDYCQAGLPVIACLEESSDAGRIVQRAGAGLAVPAGDVGSLVSAILRLNAEWRGGSLAHRSLSARALYDTELSAAAAASRILAVIHSEGR